MSHHNLDSLDKKILRLVSEDARVPFLEVARACNVSGAAIHQRIQKLTALGVLKGSQFIIDPEKIGYETCAYVALYLKNPKFGPCLSSNVSVRPLSPDTDHCLGEPLPHQLTNQTQAHLSPINLWHPCNAAWMHYEVLISVSRCYPSVKGRLPTRYSPVRRFPLMKSTEVSFLSFSLDLHVLGTPPAFILSQDRTLN